MISRLSMRTSLLLPIILLGILGMVFALATGALYRELALDNQRTALTNLISLKVMDLLNGLVEKSHELGADLHREQAFRKAFDEHNQVNVTSLLNNQFHRFYQTANIIKLEKLYAFDADYKLTAESSEGSTNIGKAGVICDKLMQHASQRQGADHLKILSELCFSGSRTYLAVMVPIGGLRPIGYIVVVTDPAHSLIPLGTALGMPLSLTQPGGVNDYRSADWPTPGALDKVLLADYMLKTTDNNNALTITMAADLGPLSAKLHEARNIVLFIAGMVTLLAVFSALLVMQKTALNPLGILMRHIQSVIKDRSHLGEPVSISGNIEISELASDFNTLTAELKNLYEKLGTMAFSDPLTNLPNRALFNDRANQAIKISDRQQTCFALFMMDLDRFKQVNDTLGHTVGDKLLQQVAERLLKALRRTDTIIRVCDETLARFGGDEFAALLPLIGNADYASLAAKRILHEMQQPFMIESHSLNVGISIGIAIYPDNGKDADTLIRQADVAMYQAKKDQRGFAFYDSEQDRHSVFQLTLESELRAALEQNKLQLYFQPKIDLATGNICSAEALLRWIHPERGFIPPDEFIPIAEQSGLIEPLTRWVLDKALEQCTLWHTSGYPISVAVNLSARSLHNSNITQDVEQALAKWKFPARHLVLELTESAVMADPVQAMGILTLLNNKGVLLSVDDFGTGYSSLAYLKKLPVDEIKIDKSFVMDMIVDSNDSAIVRSIIDLAHNMSLKVVAEGVESNEIMQHLTSLGCDIAQGYYFSRPLPPVEFMQQLTLKNWTECTSKSA